jgi:hypothetical protein
VEKTSIGQGMYRRSADRSDASTVSPSLASHCHDLGPDPTTRMLGRVTSTLAICWAAPDPHLEQTRRAWVSNSPANSGLPGRRSTFHKRSLRSWQGHEFIVRASPRVRCDLPDRAASGRSAAAHSANLRNHNPSDGEGVVRRQHDTNRNLSSPNFSPGHRVCWTDASTCEKSGLVC